MALLSRLLDPSRGFVAEGAQSESALRADVLRNLQILCSTRLGDAPARPDFGLPDVGELAHAMPNALGDIGRALEAMLRKYEPRLADVRVRPLPTDPYNPILRVEITASLKLPGRRAPVRFETRIDASRNVHVG
jgi:type VI secretion system protein